MCGRLLKVSRMTMRQLYNSSRHLQLQSSCAIVVQGNFRPAAFAGITFWPALVAYHSPYMKAAWYSISARPCHAVNLGRIVWFIQHHEASCSLLSAEGCDPRLSKHGTALAHLTEG